jgi:hypothetical protein
MVIRPSSFGLDLLTANVPSSIPGASDVQAPYDSVEKTIVVKIRKMKRRISKGSF